MVRWYSFYTRVRIPLDVKVIFDLGVYVGALVWFATGLQIDSKQFPIFREFASFGSSKGRCPLKGSPRMLAKAIWEKKSN